MAIIRLKALDNSDVSFDETTLISTGAMKDVYFSPDRSYVVAFYKKKPDFNAKDRLLKIVNIYRDRIFNQAGGEYWKNLFCWPSKVVEYNGKLGLVAPAFPKHFFFQYGSKSNDYLGWKGKEKEGKFFSTALYQNRDLDPRERGDWSSYFRICILICRAIRRLHAAGLAHSDLSYKNILIDPQGRNACVIDIDGLVVPGLFPPDVEGTPDFIAPEVMKTANLKSGDPNKNLPRRETDQHALSVLIYMYLLYRHPLDGRNYFGPDLTTEEQKELMFGEKALFIENLHDTKNRYDLNWVQKNESKRFTFLMPWWDLNKIPYTILGPYLSPLVEKAFIAGLHDPKSRPTADDWETALVKTVDLMQPCQNKSCDQKWFVFDNSTRPICPFCRTPFKGQLPVLNLYSKHTGGKFIDDNHRIMVYDGQYLYQWHANRNIFPNEKLTDTQKKPVGYFSFHQGQWIFINQTLPGMKDHTENKEIPPNNSVALTEGKQILLSPEEGGRLLHVQIVNA